MHNMKHKAFYIHQNTHDHNNLRSILQLYEL